MLKIALAIGVVPMVLSLFITIASIVALLWVIGMTEFTLFMILGHILVLTAAWQYRVQNVHLVNRMRRCKQIEQEHQHLVNHNEALQQLLDRHNNINTAA